MSEKQRKCSKLLIDEATGKLSNQTWTTNPHLVTEGSETKTKNNLQHDVNYTVLPC